MSTQDDIAKMISVSVAEAERAFGLAWEGVVAVVQEVSEGVSAASQDQIVAVLEKTFENEDVICVSVVLKSPISKFTIEQLVVPTTGYPVYFGTSRVMAQVEGLREGRALRDVDALRTHMASLFADPENAAVSKLRALIRGLSESG